MSDLLDIVVDLSHWEDVLSFEDVRASGVVGVIYKATEGSDYVDPTYAECRKEAEKAGLKWGAYHFLRPGDLRTQAQFFLKEVGTDLELYCADHEDLGVSLGDLKEFLFEILRQTGKHAVIYSGHVIKEQVGDDPDQVLEHFRLWVAHYTDEAEPDWPRQIWPKWWLWQYTEDGSCPGINGDVDRNKYAGSAEELVREWAHPRAD
jgi:GH25 family lysozyme M1 (1,4-beta-N-acetylmuramidase)